MMIAYRRTMPMQCTKHTGLQRAHTGARVRPLVLGQVARFRKGLGATHHVANKRLLACDRETGIQRED